MFKRVILSGGAVPALSFFGSLQYLEHVGLLSGVDTFVGSSAGSVVGFLTILGYTPHESCEFFMSTGVSTHMLTELDVFDAMFGQQTCLDTLGLDDGSRWLAFLGDAVETKLNCRDLTFAELAKITGKVFVVCVTNLTKVRREYLSVDTAPDMSVVLAVRMSLSIPIMYVPILYEGSLYVDGSLLDNLPIASCVGGKGPATTLALYIHTGTGDTDRQQGCEPTLPSPFMYLGLLLGVVIKHAQRYNGNDMSERTDITRVGVVIPESDSLTCCFDLRSLAFQIDHEKLDALMRSGYSAARRVIEPMLMLLPVLTSDGPKEIVG